MGEMIPACAPSHTVQVSLSFLGQVMPRDIVQRMLLATLGSESQPAPSARVQPPGAPAALNGSLAAEAEPAGGAAGGGQEAGAAPAAAAAAVEPLPEAAAQKQVAPAAWTDSAGSLELSAPPAAVAGEWRKPAQAPAPSKACWQWESVESAERPQSAARWAPSEPTKPAPEPLAGLKLLGPSQGSDCGGSSASGYGSCPGSAEGSDELPALLGAGTASVPAGRLSFILPDIPLEVRQDAGSNVY